MRLDDWQKFIESQFVVETMPPEPLPAAPASAPGPIEPAHDSPAETPGAAVNPDAASPPKRLFSSGPAIDARKIDLPSIDRYLGNSRRFETPEAHIPAAAARPAAPSVVREDDEAAAAQRIPPHIRMLLLLDTDAPEVAQASYKKPFTESRAQLVQRLLDPVLTLEETARILNVCPTTVRRYTNRGVLTAYRKQQEGRSTPPATETDRETRQRRFRLSAVLEFLESHKSGPTMSNRSAVQGARNEQDDQGVT